ncbi:MAG: bifunctional riboflavin kinase/FAD synthetase [Campylobacterota bacterium]
MKKSSSILVNKDTITSIAVGGFDGMHYAHQELFKNLDKNGAILSIESGYANLTPKKYRQEYCKYPIFYYELDEIKHLDGLEFIELIKYEFPKLKRVVVGFDFCFGKNRKYCVSQLKEIFNGEVIILDEIKLDDIPVHSRVIRQYLKKGDIKTANRLLAKEYKIFGKHIKGQGLGSKKFVATLNLEVKDFLLPKQGVYATKTIVDNQEFLSVTFLGHRVTTDGNFAVETHIIDQQIDIKDSTIQIKFYEKIRDNKKFESFEELKQQINFDIKNSKTILVK